ncbi:MAG: pilus assembly protein PilM [Lachnospiraceae bacterium]|nr:pilus assembly protein PilM [Lachnospiraceae bacterium]
MSGKKKPLLGISTEHNRLSITVMHDGKVTKNLYVEIPDNIALHGEIVSENLFSELLKDTLKANRIREKYAALVISSDHIFIRSVTMPRMSLEQIKYNIPFEFRDYIRGELKEYIFDYAYRPPIDNKGEEPVINLLAVAMERSRMDMYKRVFARAGLKLVRAMPLLCAYEELLKAIEDPEEVNKERCFLDLGNESSRMLIFKNARYKLIHSVDIGERRIIQTIADEMNVDMHIAMTYLKSNYEDCWHLPAVMNNYRDISIEVLKGLNFYEVSDMSSRLRDIVLTGGGALIEPLSSILKERINMNVITMGELYPEFDISGVMPITAPSVGILL